MSRRSIAILAAALCIALLPARSPAPLVYTPGEGWVYEAADGFGKWRRERAKDQLDVAKTALERNDLSTAQRAAERVVRTWPLSDFAPEAQFILASSHELSGSDERAFNEYQRVIEKYPKSEKVNDALRKQYEIALRFLQGQRYKLWNTIPFLPNMEKTAGLFEKIVNNGPYSDVAPHAQLRIGAAQEKRSEYGLAVAAYERALDRYHDRPVIAADALFRAGSSHHKQAKKAEYDQSSAGNAIEVFNDFVTLHPDDRRVPQATKVINELKTEQARGNYEIAKYYEKRKKWNGALIYYNEVILKDPNSPYAAEARGKIDQIKLLQQAAAQP